ncbi:FAD:protein FMN transferase [uncultured Polaribacter sp.]|uniref:FAD:protein FMN transferase n=1 Tax=uncultured Polaribacter sp. TaxID=174711 RepID=UPI00261CD9CE|nr:FAD:protein FMN transferase [uncultured Polaribacter sp.]
MKVIKYIKIFCFLLFFVACKKENVSQDYTLKGFVFGTTYKITYLNAEKNYTPEIEALFQKINKSLSTYLPNSDISKINNQHKNIKVDDYFIEVFEKSKRIFKETNGYFDPTVGNLVNAYGFGPKKEMNNLTQQEVQKQMQWVGFNKVAIKNKFIVKELPEIYLDFNSIAKGFGVDVISRFLESKKLNNYLVEIGGEIRTKGFKKNKKPWLIKLVDPVKAIDNSGFKKINLSNKSMATSGNYRKFRLTKEGVKYVHTINPKTGLALESNLLSASVISNLDCADSDAYATAFMAMGLEKSKNFLQKKTNLQVILIYIDKKGNLAEFTNYTHD